MNRYTEMIMLGFLNHNHYIQAVTHHEVDVADLIPIVKEMQEAWGGQEGLLDWMRLYENNEAEGNMFAKTMMDKSDKGSWLGGFCSEYTEEEWREEVMGATA